MIMFIPGETISHKFVVPFMREDILKIIVSYRQDGHIILTKTVASYSVSAEESGVGSSFSITLSQQESLLFRDDMPFSVQLNVIFTNGARCASREIERSNGFQHIREVVT